MSLMSMSDVIDVINVRIVICVIGSGRTHRVAPTCRNIIYITLAVSRLRMCVYRQVTANKVGEW